MKPLNYYKWCSQLEKDDWFELFFFDEFKKGGKLKLEEEYENYLKTFLRDEKINEILIL